MEVNHKVSFSFLCDKQILIFNCTDGNFKLVTVLEAVSASGNVMPPLIIFKSKQLYVGWMNGVEAAKEAYFSYSNSGYTNDNITHEWLIKVFDSHSTPAANDPQSRGLPNKLRRHLLIMDNHHSHITYRFASFCLTKNILVLNLLPHTTHAL